MKNKNEPKNEQSKNNNSRNINNNNISNSLNSSKILTSNNFFIIKEIKKKSKSKSKSKEKENENNKSLINDNSMKNVVNNIIVDNNYLNKSGVKEAKRNIDKDVALYQDFVIDGYKNPLLNNKRNIIERLGDCIEKKYNTIEYLKYNQIKKIPKSTIFKNSQDYQKSKLGTEHLNEPKSNIINEKRLYTVLDKKKKHSYSTSNILDKKNTGDFPLLLSIPSSYIKKFSSCSEKKRNENNLFALFKLKHFLTLYWKQRREIVKEFFDKFNINDSLFYKDSHLDNFANYVNDNIINDNNLNKYNCNIETRLPMLDIITKGIKYKSNMNNTKYNNFNKYKKNSQILGKKLQNQHSKKYINDSEDILSEEKEYIDSIIIKGKIDKYRSFLNRNYKKSVTNKLLKGLTKEEKLNYFSKKKYGSVEIRDKNNLANNLKKQALYIKKFNPTMNKFFNKNSIKYYNDDDLKKLNDELNDVSYSIIKKFESQRMKKTQEKILGTKKLNDKIIDKLNHRLYYTIKEKYHLNHPEVIPTQKKKLLEYIIVQKLKERNNFEQKLLKDLK